MKELPLYDADAALVCTIRASEVPERIALVERIRAAMERLERTEHGMRLYFAPDPAVEEDVRRFAVDEKRCCQFWGFAVESEVESLVFRWECPPMARPMIDRLAKFLDGDEPVTALAGLL